MPDWISTLIIAGAPVVAALGTLWLTNRQQRERDRMAQVRTIRNARRERLRSLYSEAMAMALAVTPRSLGYRFPRDGSDVPAVDPVDADRMRARLMIEPAENEDEVLQAFVGVVLFSGLYRGEKDGPDTPTEELRKTEKQVHDNMDKLQALCRERLAALEK